MNFWAILEKGLAVNADRKYDDLAKVRFCVLSKRQIRAFVLFPTEFAAYNLYKMVQQETILRRSLHSKQGDPSPVEGTITEVETASPRLTTITLVTDTA